MSLDDLDMLAVRGPHSVKWSLFGEEVLPLWVADMDFPVSDAVLQALRQRLEKRLGYAQMGGDPELLQAIVEQQGSYGLSGLSPKNLWLTTSVVPGIYASVLGLSSPGDEIITQVPVYPPFLNAISDYGRVLKANPMVLGAHGYEIDFDHLEGLVGPATRMLMLCNPQNPTGRVFTRSELERLAQFALKHRLWIMSDELHSGLVLEGAHIPIASVDPEVAMRTVTLTGPCKTYNTAGLGGGVVISHNTALLERMKKATAGVMGHANVASMAMWVAALHHGESWRQEVLAYLRQNRDFVAAFLAQHLPHAQSYPAQGTYLAWIDLRAYKLEGVQKFLLEKAKVALNDGPPFGSGYQGFVRLNFATSRQVLQEALERMAQALNTHDSSH